MSSQLQSFAQGISISDGSFQKYTVIIAIIILIGALTVTGVALYASRNSTKYPPVIAGCPDYWKMNDMGECVNPKDPSDIFVSGDKSICEKQSWANSTSPPIPWDGVTNTLHDCRGYT